MAQFQRCTVHFSRINFNDAGEVLAKVQNGHIAPFRNGFDRHILPDADMHGTLFNYFGNMALKLDGRDDFLFPTLVIHFAVVETGVIVGRSNGFHGFAVGCIGMHTVFIFNSQQPGHSRIFAVNLHLIVEGEPSAVPALSQIDRQRIIAGQQIRHIIVLAVQMGGIIGKSRCKQHIAHFLAIDFCFIQAEGGDRQSRFLHILSGY